MIPKSLTFFVFLFFYVEALWALSPEAVDLNNGGVEKLVAEEPYAAYKLFLDALSKEAFHPGIRINLGLSFELNEEFGKAYKEYMTAHRYAKTPEEQFVALFNAGNAAAKNKNIDLALKTYQMALDLQPDSEEVKKNIELLWQGGGGGGKGGENQQDQQDQQNQGNGKGPPQKQKPKPKKFKSKELTKNDVRKILEEIKNQEQKIRAKEYEKGSKEAPKDKDW